MTTHEKSPIANVIEGGYCVGCGGCAVTNVNLKLKFDAFGLLHPSGEIQNAESAGEACPFAASRDENTVGASLFASDIPRHNAFVGFYDAIFVGHVVADDLRSKGSSSGFVTWILIELLKRKVIDGVIHVRPSTRDRTLFEYGVSKTIEEIIDSAKSKYHPAHFDIAVNSIRGDGKRYAFVGVPCFVKSIRLLSEQDKVLSSQISFCIALVCGHMKSSAYSQFIASQVGIAPNNLTAIDFRVKDPSAPASHYRFSVGGEIRGTKLTRSLPNSALYGMDWGLGYFKPKACDWCDDIVGELADISSGDAWLPGYVLDPGGNNVVIVRSTFLHKLIEEERETGVLEFDVKTPEDVYTSQAGNYRHRREGLSVRIDKADRDGVWHPRKRTDVLLRDVAPKRKRLYLQRELLSSQSHEVFLSTRKNPVRFAIKMASNEFRYYAIDNRLLRGMVKFAIQVIRLALRLIRVKVIK